MPMAILTPTPRGRGERRDPHRGSGGHSPHRSGCFEGWGETPSSRQPGEGSWNHGFQIAWISRELARDRRTPAM